MSRPVFLFAFAYNPATALPEVVQELKTIDRLLSETEGEVKVVWQVTQPDLERDFDLLRNDLRLFHFSGHAGPRAIQLNRDYHTAALSFADGLARLVGMAPSLRLVFLNGCSTEGQAQIFLDQGIPAVIATTKPLLDHYAVDFARRFYQNFTRRNSRMTLQQAFDAAFFSFISEQGSFNQTMLYEQTRSIGSDDDSNEPLYECCCPDAVGVQAHKNSRETHQASQDAAGNRAPAALVRKHDLQQSFALTLRLDSS